MSLIQILGDRQGRYLGQGIAHDQDGFQGELKLNTLSHCNGLRLEYTASREAALLHHEHSTIAPDTNGILCLWTLSSNTPSMLCHALVSEEYNSMGEHVLTFEHGDLTGSEGFRERVCIILHQGGALSYTYAWGMPGEALAERSHVKLFPSRVAESV
jgi:hypothetical protein